MLRFAGEGLRTALSRECVLYVAVPVIVNLLLLSLAGYLLFSYLNDLLFSLFSWWPSFLIFLLYIVSFIFGATIFLVACYFFTTIATIIASPFYGLLAERVELKLTGRKPPDLGIVGLIRDVPRILMRELKKLLYTLPWLLLCLVLTVIPVLNLLCPACWLLLAAWLGALQYCDYAYDNHRISFTAMRRDLGRQPLNSLVFGGLIAAATAVPLLNLIAPAAAVCAGTRYFIELQRRYGTPEL